MKPDVRTSKIANGLVWNVRKNGPLDINALNPLAGAKYIYSDSMKKAPLVLYL